LVYLQVSGKTQRIAEFQEVLDEIEAEHPNPSSAGPVGDKLLTSMPSVSHFSVDTGVGIGS
jgi:hypothetical protein